MTLLLFSDPAIPSIRATLQRGLLVFMICLAFTGNASADYVDVEKWAAATQDAAIRTYLGEILEIHRALGRASDIQARLLIAEDEAINAFATEIKGEKVIVLNQGTLDEFKADREAVAAILAHEYGHHAKGHIASSQASESALSVLGALVGAVVDARFGTAGLGRRAAGAGATLLARSFDRGQELEADTVGLAWMIEAGYNPEGALRLQKRFLEMARASGDAGFSFFQTHPSSAERVDALQTAIAADSKARPLAGAPLLTFSYPEDDDDDAPALAPDNASTLVALGPLPDELLSPVEGVDLERYAAISNEIVSAGNDAPVLKKHKLSVAAYQRITDVWVERMRRDESFKLSQKYSAFYLKASTGNYAVWGRDVARSLNEGLTLQEKEPVSIETWGQLQRVQSSDQAAFNAELKSRNLSSYDWNIVSNWWGRRIAQGASDTLFMQRLSAAMSR